MPFTAGENGGGVSLLSSYFLLIFSSPCPPALLYASTFALFFWPYNKWNANTMTISPLNIGTATIGIKTKQNWVNFHKHWPPSTEVNKKKQTKTISKLKRCIFKNWFYTFSRFTKWLMCRYTVDRHHYIEYKLKFQRHMWVAYTLRGSHLWSNTPLIHLFKYRHIKYKLNTYTWTMHLHVLVAWPITCQRTLLFIANNLRGCLPFQGYASHSLPQK